MKSDKQTVRKEKNQTTKEQIGTRRKSAHSTPFHCLTSCHKIECAQLNTARRFIQFTIGFQIPFSISFIFTLGSSSTKLHLKLHWIGLVLLKVTLPFSMGGCCVFIAASHEPMNGHRSISLPITHSESSYRHV